MTDPIADMFTRIRNAQMARRPSVRVPHSKIKARIADILKEEGYVDAIEQVKDGERPFLQLSLKYSQKEPVIRSIKRESTPGHRKYKKSSDLPKVLNDYGIAIISTSQGIMTNKEARKRGIGGEIICLVS